MQTKRQLKRCTRNVHPSFADFLARTWCKFSYFTNSKLTLGVKFIFIISLMHTLSDKVRFVQGKLKPEEAFTTKKWMVHTEHLLAQAHIYIYVYIYIYIYRFPLSRLSFLISRHTQGCKSFSLDSMCKDKKNNLT